MKPELVDLKVDPKFLAETFERAMPKRLYVHPTEEAQMRAWFKEQGIQARFRWNDTESQFVVNLIKATDAEHDAAIDAHDALRAPREEAELAERVRLQEEEQEDHWVDERLGGPLSVLRVSLSGLHSDKLLALALGYYLNAPERDKLRRALDLLDT